MKNKLNIIIFDRREYKMDPKPCKSPVRLFYVLATCDLMKSNLAKKKKNFVFDNFFFLFFYSFLVFSNAILWYELVINVSFSFIIIQYRKKENL